jgi:thioredoxin reductase (NADPH)
MPNIQLQTRQRIRIHGDTHLEEVSVLCSDTNKIERVPASSMFIFIGYCRVPNGWGSGQRDDRGFLLTGPDLIRDSPHPGGLPARSLLLETNVPGIFAVGDVRRIRQTRLQVSEGSVLVQLSSVSEQF